MRIARFTITKHHRERDRIVIARPKDIEGIWAVNPLTGESQLQEAFEDFISIYILKLGLYARS